MTRLAKFTCWLIVAAMAAMAAAATVAQWPVLAHHPASLKPIGWRLLFSLWFYPGWIAAAILLSERRLRPKGMELSSDYRRFTQATLVVVALFSAAMQAWFAAMLLFRDLHVLHASPQGVSMLVGGAIFVIYGNSGAKLAPPTGPAAPEPGRWIRTSLRKGWAQVLMGMVMMAGAFASPTARVAIILAIAPVALASSAAWRRMLRSTAGPPSPA
ncbi:MAG: hypothetical protein JSS35_19320 [Proteobacteria bacterium]|nr:hypothetical protein [Pseudomonadota bacterium]